MYDIYVIYYNIELNSILQSDYVTFENNYGSELLDYIDCNIGYQSAFIINMKTHHYD